MSGGLSRRGFLRQGAAACAGCAAAWASLQTVSAAPVSGRRALAPFPHRGDPQPASGVAPEPVAARYWEPLAGGRVRCLLCPNACERGEGEAGLCHTRTNRGGRLFSLTYGRPCTICTDPLAKNPLYHVDPGAEAIGVATAGCNLTCKYCQNWDVSQVGPAQTRNMEVTPAQVVAKARERNLRWITFSYTEPVAYFEYAVETARLARAAGVRVAVATAAFIASDPLRELLQNVDAVSVTLKGYDDAFYRDVCGCSFGEVTRAIGEIHASGKWLEVVTLIVPGLNDQPDGIRKLARLLAANDRNTPWHFLRFAPAFKLKNLQPTPVRTLEAAREVALAEGLKFVYLDLSGHAAANTVCPRCATTVVERAGFTVVNNSLRRGLCPKCSYRIPGLLT